MRHDAGYIDSTIETVRQHKGTNNSWPGWANALADDIEDQRAEVQRLLLGMELAWGLIANADIAEWSDLESDWTVAAVKWRDEHWHTAIDRRPAALSEGETA